MQYKRRKHSPPWLIPLIIKYWFSPRDNGNCTVLKRNGVPFFPGSLSTFIDPQRRDFHFRRSNHKTIHPFDEYRLTVTHGGVVDP